MEEDIAKRTKYTISLEDFEFASLPIQFARRDRTLPLWRNTNEEYYEIEIHETQDTEAQPKNDGSKATITCYICDIDVPKEYLYEHTNGQKHKTCMKIVDNVLERARKHIKLQALVANSNNSTNYCDACSVVINPENMEHHNSSHEHRNHEIRDKHLNNLLLILTGKDAKVEKQTENTGAVFTFTARGQKNGEMNGEVNGDKEEESNNKQTPNNIDEATELKTNVHKETLSNLITKIKNAFKSGEQPKCDENEIPETIAPKLVYDVKALKELGNIKDDESKTLENIAKVKEPVVLTEEIDWDFYAKYLAQLNQTIHSVKTTRAANIVDIITMNGSSVRVHKDNYEGFGYLGDEMYCKMCKVKLDENHSNHRYSKQHVTKLMRPLEDVHCIRKINEKQSFCVICNEMVENVPLHLLCDEKHHSELDAAKLEMSGEYREATPVNKIKKETPMPQPKPPVAPPQKSTKHCTVCDRTIDVLQFQSHLNGQSHKNMVQLKQQQKNQQKVPSTDKNKVHFCKICQVNVSNTPNCIKTHEKGTPHKNNLASLETAKSDSNIPKGFFCGFCQVKVPDNPQNIKEHLDGNSHRKRVKEIISGS